MRYTGFLCFTSVFTFTKEKRNTGDSSAFCDYLHFITFLQLFYNAFCRKGAKKKAQAAGIGAAWA